METQFAKQMSEIQSEVSMISVVNQLTDKSGSFLVVLSVHLKKQSSKGKMDCVSRKQFNSSAV